MAGEEPGDFNEKSIVDALEKVGATIQRLNLPGVPDLLVGYRQACFLIECKAEPGPRGGTSHARLTPEQEKFFFWWNGQRAVVRSPEAALRVIGAVR